MSANKERVQKIIAAAGICSRREAEQLIEWGEVSINGRIAKLGDHADASRDHIKVQNKLLKPRINSVVVALFKPRGVRTRPAPDQQSLTGSASEFVQNLKDYRLHPIGSLDSDAEGLLLLTNDGSLSARLTSSRVNVPKTYQVKIDGQLSDVKLRRLSHGVEAEDRRVKLSGMKVMRVLKGKQWLEVKCVESQNRMIRKVFESVGHPVDKILRVDFAGVALKKLKRGEHRMLNQPEVELLYQVAGLKK